MIPTCECLEFISFAISHIYESVMNLKHSFGPLFSLCFNFGHILKANLKVVITLMGGGVEANPILEGKKMFGFGKGLLLGAYIKKFRKIYKG